MGTYSIPKVNLLSSNELSTVNHSVTAEQLEDFLKKRGISANVVYSEDSIVSTVYAIHLTQGVRVSKINGILHELSIELKAADIELMIPIPGTSYLGIRAIKADAPKALLGDFVKDPVFGASEKKMRVALGRNLNGKAEWFDFEETPHLLIAGTTGSGKSVFMDSVITSLIYNLAPEELRFIMIDTHGINLSVFNQLPHLLIPVVRDARKALGVLSWVLGEIDYRFEKLSKIGVRSIETYNEQMIAEKGDKISRILVVIDDLADVMDSAPKQIEEVVCKIAHKSRQVGIHLLVSTQRPTGDVLTGMIRENFTGRVAFKTASGYDSKTIIDVAGAEHLLGNGDMLFKSLGTREPLRVQAPFVTDEEIRNVVRFIVDNNQNEDVFLVNNDAKSRKDTYSDLASLVADKQEEPDELLYDAGKIIIESQKASIGLLQRKLKISFNRATRIIDQLAEMNVVGPENGAYPRDIFMSLSQFERIVKK